MMVRFHRYLAGIVHVPVFMTKLGTPIPNKIKTIRADIKAILRHKNIKICDANSEINGKDFMVKIWRMITATPLGIAIITENLPKETLGNIYYEIGLFHAQGKETLVVKTKKAKVPSDFVRTEYITYNSHFKSQLSKFITSFLKLSNHYTFMAKQLRSDPFLEIDYLKRAYLISGNNDIKTDIRRLLKQHDFGEYPERIYKQILKS